MNSPTTVLVIEDDERLNKAFTEVLQREYRVLSTDSLRGALKSFDAADLLILDLNLSDARGLEALRVLRALTKSPIVVITGVDATLAGKAMEHGADAFLVKPVTTEQLEAGIEQAVCSRKRTEALVETEQRTKVALNDMVRAVKRRGG